MCELLVKAIDATHPDPNIDLSGCYKRGDVVVIKEDNFPWGSGELDTSVFAVVKLPGISVMDMSYLLNSHDQPVKQSAALKIPILRAVITDQMREAISRRRFSINITTSAITDKTRT